jgi:thiamine-phosphate pyrophosphorylase
MHRRLLRVIDANINRVSEGLRVMEDIARFVIEDEEMSRQLKSMRHVLGESTRDLGPDLLESRNAAGDIGAPLDLTHEHQNLESVVRANSRRAQEGLRVLEELSKLPNLKSLPSAKQLKRSRYQVYDLEKTLVARLAQESRSHETAGDET